MADLKGGFIPNPYRGGGRFKGMDGNYKFYPYPLGPSYNYRVRAWDLTDSVWAIWTTPNAPSLTPPVGHEAYGHSFQGATLIGIS